MRGHDQALAADLQNHRVRSLVADVDLAHGAGKARRKLGDALRELDVRQRHGYTSSSVSTNARPARSRWNRCASRYFSTVANTTHARSYASSMSARSSSRSSATLLR